MKGKFKDSRCLCFVDTETSGLDPHKHEILEIAAIRLRQPTPESGKFEMPVEEGRIHYYVKPARPVDPLVAKINGYSPELWEKRGAVSLHVALGGLLPILDDSRMAGQHPKFDFDFIKEGLDRLGWGWPWKCSYHLIDVASMAWPLVVHRLLPGVRQEGLVELLGLGKQTHGALDDVEQCVKVYIKLLEMYQLDLTQLPKQREPEKEVSEPEKVENVVWAKRLRILQR